MAIDAFGNAIGESVAGAMTTRTLSAEGMQKPVLQSERIAPLGPMDFGPELQRVPEFAPPPSSAELQAAFRASEREYRMATDTGAVNLPISGSASESASQRAAVAKIFSRTRYSQADRANDPNYQLALAAQQRMDAYQAPTLPGRSISRLAAGDRAQAHALGVYDAGAGMVEGSGYSFGVVGTPESRATWAIQSSKAAIDGLRAFASDVGGATERWWDKFTGDDPVAIREATALPASVAIGTGLGLGAHRLGAPSATRLGAATSEVFYKVESGGVRGEVQLTSGQRAQVQSYLANFDMSDVNVRWVDDRNLNTAYGHMYGEEILHIGSDVVPGNVGLGTRTANSRISINGTLAHEIVGHREASLAGMTQDLVFLEEAQASIRAARFAPDLTSTERFSLLRDAITRLQTAPGGPVGVRDVKGQLYIQKR